MAETKAPQGIKGTYADLYGQGFQRHILAVILRTPLIAVKYRSVLDPHYFVSAIERTVARAGLDFIDANRTLPTRLTLTEKVRQITDDETFASARQAIAYLYADDVSDAAGVTDDIVTFGKTQAMCNAVVAAAKKLSAGDRNIIGLIKEAEMVGLDIADFGINFKTADRTGWYTNTDELDRVPTGITHLDIALGGGALRGALYVILSVAKKGKSTLLVNIGYGAQLQARGFNVVYLSHEMKKNRVAMRFDSRMAVKREILDLRKTDPDKYAAWMSDRAKKVMQGNLQIQDWPTRTCSVSNARSYISMMAGQGFTPDVMLVDYADIMKPERRLGEARHEQAGIYEDLRGLAGEYNAVCWTASQAKQGALAKTTLDMGDFAESFEKAAIMDCGVAIAQTDDEKAVGRCRLVLVGQRDEADGTSVECTIARDMAMIKSVALYDAAGTLISGEGSGLPQNKPPATKDGKYANHSGNGHAPKPKPKPQSRPMPSKVVPA